MGHSLRAATASTRNTFRSATTPIMMIKNGKINLRVPLDDILYIQAEHVYVRIFLRSQQSILYRISLSDILRQLNAEQFARVHRSYVINLKSIRQFKSNGIMIENQLIPVGRVYRDRLKNQLQRLNLEQE